VARKVAERLEPSFSKDSAVVKKRIYTAILTDDWQTVFNLAQSALPYVPDAI